MNGKKCTNIIKTLSRKNKNCVIHNKVNELVNNGDDELVYNGHSYFACWFLRLSISPNTNLQQPIHRLASIEDVENKVQRHQLLNVLNHQPMLYNIQSMLYKSASWLMNRRSNNINICHQNFNGDVRFLYPSFGASFTLLQLRSFTNTDFVCCCSWIYRSIVHIQTEAARFLRFTTS